MIIGLEDLETGYSNLKVVLINNILLTFVMYKNEQSIRYTRSIL